MDARTPGLSDELYITLKDIAERQPLSTSGAVSEEIQKSQLDLITQIVKKNNYFEEEKQEYMMYCDENNMMIILDHLSDLFYDEKDLELINAIENDNVENVKKMLEEGANPNARDTDDYTALMKSSIKENEDIVKLLLEYAAKTNLLDSNNLNVFDHTKNEEILKIILGSKDTCINYDVDDFLTSEQFKDIPFFVIMIGDNRYCLSIDWIRFMESEDNIMANWVQNPNASGVMTSTGFYGMAGEERFHKLSPGFTFYVDQNSFFIMKEEIENNEENETKTYCIFLLGNNRKMRLGNTEGIYGMSMLHGQSLEDVYSVEGYTTLNRKQILEFKMKETNLV